jgi:hypothetical protein
MFQVKHGECPKFPQGRRPRRSGFSRDGLFPHLVIDPFEDRRILLKFGRILPGIAPPYLARFGLSRQ